MTTRPQKTANEPFMQAAARRFSSTQSTPRVVIPPPPRTFRKYCAQSEKTATSPSCKQITQPSGAAAPRNSDAHKRIAVPKAFCVLWEHPTKPQKRQSLPFYPLATQGFRNVRNAPRVVIPPPSETPRVSVCKPLCAILLAKASVYPLSSAKANVGRFAGDYDKSFFAAWYPLMEVGDGCL